MGWRGPVMLVLLLAVGATGGYAASSALADPSIGSGIAQPVDARSPSLPVDPEVRPRTDPDDPALQPGIALTTTTLGSGEFAVTFPVPDGWNTNPNASNEVKWKQPGTSNNTYVLRVTEIRSQNLSVEDTIEARMARLDAEEDEVDFLERGPNSLEYTYISNEGTARHSFMRWLDVSGDGIADVEVVVHGRERDVPGTSDLIARVAAGMRAA